MQTGRPDDDRAQDDDLEPFQGRHDWDRAFKQNPDQPRFDVPNYMRDRVHGRETAEDAQARAVGHDAEEYIRISHLDFELHHDE